jgi:hypothetical protein
VCTQRFDEGDISTPLTCAAPAGARCEAVAFEQARRVGGKEEDVGKYLQQISEKNLRTKICKKKESASRICTKI